MAQVREGLQQPHTLAVHVLRDPIAGDDSDDDAEQEVDAARALHHDYHLQEGS